MASPDRLPSFFVGHGAPTMALENDRYTRALNDFGRRHSPEAIAVVSAHWEEEAPVRVTATAKPELVYDFYGFPPEMYELQYPAPGNPELAQRIVKALDRAGIPATKDPTRGLDHGCWVPLFHMYPAADIPVLQVSLPEPRGPDELLKIGKALEPLRADGILLVGSGNVVHNLRLAMAQGFRPKDAPADPWASQFDSWFRERLEAMDAQGLAKWASAPGGRLAVPTTEHYDPSIVTMGAASQGERVEHVFEGIYHGNVSMRCFAVGSP